MKIKIIIILLVVLTLIIGLSIAVVATGSDPLNLFKQKNENGESNEESELVDLNHFKQKKENGELNKVGELVKMIRGSNDYNMDYDDLPAYSYDSFLAQILLKKPSSCPTILPETSHAMSNLTSFNDRFPIKKLIVVNNDCICAEYKLDRNCEQLHTFAVFNRSVKKADNTENYELWQYNGELYFAYPDLTSDDFSEYSGKRVRIDESLISIDLSHAVFFNSSDDPTLLHSEETVLLKDGFMVVDYIVDTIDDSEIQITDITFVAYDSTDSKYPNNSLMKYSFVPEFSK